MVNYICPLTNICEIYKNWNQKTSKNILDVIKYEGTFSCIALDDVMEEVLFDEESAMDISKRVRDPNLDRCILTELATEIAQIKDNQEV